jgi:hypothetical protein
LHSKKKNNHKRILSALTLNNTYTEKCWSVLTLPVVHIHIERAYTLTQNISFAHQEWQALNCSHYEFAFTGLSTALYIAIAKNRAGAEQNEGKAKRVPNKTQNLFRTLQGEKIKREKMKLEREGGGDHVSRHRH